MYNAPGVYIQDIVSGSQLTQASSSVGILIGVTRSGVVNVAQKIGSWTEFIDKYANGLDTPFLENSYLPYAVYGFFANGGKELYVGSIKKQAAKARIDNSPVNGITAVASTEGSWGNEIMISIRKSADYDAMSYPAYDVTVEMRETKDSVTVTDCSAQDISSKVMSNSKVKTWLSAFDYNYTIAKDLAEEDIYLGDGSDGSDLTDIDYLVALSSMVGILDDVTMVAIPGQTSATINDALVSYCDANGLFPILDMPMGSTVEATKAYRRSISAWTGAIAYPWGKVNDPLTDTLKTVPTAGHVMGVYARIIENRGIHKAPAGIDAVVRGFVEMEYPLTHRDISILNSIGVVCICSRPNAGIVLWGARSLNSEDSTMKYVTDGLLNLYIKKSLYDATQFAVFEPNDESLWSRVQATCKAFLETLRTSGALKGTADEAYYVTINNTDATIADGQLNIEIGYAPVKPAEFVIIKLAHNIEAQ